MKETYKSKSIQAKISYQTLDNWGKGQEPVMFTLEVLGYKYSGCASNLIHMISGIPPQIGNNLAPHKKVFLNFYEEPNKFKMEEEDAITLMRFISKTLSYFLEQAEAELEKRYGAQFLAAQRQLNSFGKFRNN